MDRDTILNHGEPAWWWLRDITKAHLIVDVRPRSAKGTVYVDTRCGDVFAVQRLERQFDPKTTDYLDPAPKCRACTQHGVIR